MVLAETLIVETILPEVAKRLVGIAIPASGKKVTEKTKELRHSFQQPIQEYVKRYLKRHGNIKILGMSRPASLDQIYTKVLLLDPETIRRIETVEGLEQIYRDARQRGFSFSNSKAENGMDVANDEQYLCVLGGPGIGKTTYLMKIGLEALLSQESQYRHELIPVFLELKNFTEPDLKLTDEIIHEFEICGFPDAAKFTDKALKSGNLLILLDGLDEVPSNNVNRVIRAINDLSDQYDKNRFIVSCRIAAYHSDLKGYRDVAIAEFTKEQISQFISNWFLADPNPNLTREQKIKNGSVCWQQLQDLASIPTKELAQTPLLLTFICLVYRNSQTITDNRASLYAEALDILLKGWYREKSLEESWNIYQYLSPRLEKELLAEIAYVAFEEDRLFFKKDDLAQQITTFLEDRPKAPKDLDSDAVIDAIVVQQGILVERAKDVYSFSHLTLQEYLCAEYVLQWNFQESLVQNHAVDDRWREVFLIISELMGKAAISLLEKLNLKTLEISEHPKLKNFLAWTKEETNSSNLKLSVKTRRILAIILVLDLMIVLVLRIATAKELISESAQELVTARNIANSCLTDLSIARELTTASTRTRDLAIKSSYSNDLTDTYKLTIDCALNSTKMLQNHDVLKNTKLQPLVSFLEEVSAQNDISIDILLTQINSILGITLEKTDLTKVNVAIKNYLLTVKLMIDCSINTSNLSVHKWVVRQM